MQELSTNVVFSGGEELRVASLDASNFLHLLRDGTDPRYHGRYLYVEKSEGGHAWINPDVIAYVEQGS
jgi:hypothetical protein